MMLNVKHLTKWFNGVRAIDDLSFTLNEGGILGIVGPNGSGKTTLLDLLTGLLTPDIGEIYLQGKNLVGLRADQIARRGVVRTFQTARLFKGLTLLDNLMMAASQDKESLSDAIFFRWKGKEALSREKALKILDTLGLLGDQNKLSSQLSIGQMRRLEIGRVIMEEGSRLLLLDEPTGSLDHEIIGEIARLIDRQRTKDKAIIIVEHNLDVIRQIADQVVVLHQGQKIAEGMVEEIFKDSILRKLYLGQGK